MKVQTERRQVFFFCFKMNTLSFLCFYFSCWLWNVFFVDMEIFLMKSTFSWKKMNNCSSFKINAVSNMSDVFSSCVLLISTMICFAFFFDGKNDRCRMVLPFWDTFNMEIDCSVMRLSCLDELLNNDILLSLSFAWYV